jgi:Protein of unknown function (DUF3313)
MAQSVEMWRLAMNVVLCVVLVLTPAQTFSAKKTVPQTTEDGLELKQQTGQRLVYLRPGATFTQYNRVALVDCHVEFSQKWLSDYNRSASLSRRISDSDLERAKTDLAMQLKKVFTEELVRGGYQVSDTVTPDTLTLRPALVNIEVSAPDLMTPGHTVYARTAGQMTLYLELWDGTTNTILARVVDAQGDSGMYGMRTSSVTNRAAADRILRIWAKELRKKLDLVRGKPAGN